MQKWFVCFTLIFSLLLAPVAHAVGLGCDNGECHVLEVKKDHSETSKKDDGKATPAAHHCCIAHVVLRNDLPEYKTASPAVKSAVLNKDAHMAPIVVGPQVEPPSHA